ARAISAAVAGYSRIAPSLLAGARASWVATSQARVPEIHAAVPLRYHPRMPPTSITVATWNVNGIRAREAQFLEWVGRDRPDVVCLQEIKASPDKLSETVCSLDGYWCYWHGSGGYSGVSLNLRRDTFPDEPR